MISFHFAFFLKKKLKFYFIKTPFLSKLTSTTQLLNSKHYFIVLKSDLNDFQFFQIQFQNR